MDDSSRNGSVALTDEQRRQVFEEELARREQARPAVAVADEAEPENEADRPPQLPTRLFALAAVVAAISVGGSFFRSGIWWRVVDSLYSSPTPLFNLAARLPDILAWVIATGAGAVLGGRSRTAQKHAAVVGAVTAGAVGCLWAIVDGVLFRSLLMSLLLLGVVIGPAVGLAVASAARGRVIIGIGTGLGAGLISFGLAGFLRTGPGLLDSLSVLLFTTAGLGTISWIAAASRPATSAAAPSDDAVPTGGSAVGVPQTNGFAMASLILSLVGISLLAVIFGHIALSQIKRQPYQTGRGLALAGTIIGWLQMAALVALIVFLVANTSMSY